MGEIGFITKSLEAICFTLHDGSSQVLMRGYTRGLVVYTLAFTIGVNFAFWLAYIFASISAALRIGRILASEGMDALVWKQHILCFTFSHSN